MRKQDLTVYPGNQVTGSLALAVVSVQAGASDTAWVQSQTDTGEALGRAGCPSITLHHDLYQS